MAPTKVIHEFQQDRHRLIAFIRSLVGDPDTAEEIFQEVTVIVLQKADQYNPDFALQDWARGIARNIIRRERRRTARLRPFENDELIALADQAFQENTTRECVGTRRGRLRTCLDNLGAESRKLLELRYGASLSLREIAQRLTRNEAAVQVALSRLRLALKKCVEQPAAPEANS